MAEEYVGDLSASVCKGRGMRYHALRKEPENW